ncbi:DUF1847 domain-containing protein [Prosthecochloris sp. ZM_2]|uniref:DUF1847 domain-containing protein n=1 Tax=Prosthecochloris sp. ZM_2 TaxID=2045206 RepID=UPI000DF8657B|nr:DUF1847 domain-containing protein [Prosthecochloris sp. ZM_2]RNA66084.1 DUF1847 domain-containing protein [Prosthecochloris sp. ZM_2]RNA66391.1 DUF1847 domain-containing protein [Prosthecochloris sp. ZM_2]
MSQQEKNESRSAAAGDTGCTACGSVNCYRQESSFPPFCPAGELDRKELMRLVDGYCGDAADAKTAQAAAYVEGRFYGRLTRVEEIIEFARKIEARKIGLATCVGLIGETRVFHRILKSNGFESYAVMCKAGSVDKSDIGIDEQLKIQPGDFEAICNPVLQADLLNRWGADLNVVIGLCVGHDALFSKHSDALVTTLLAKDRVLAHNPAAALYTSGSYYRRIMEKRDG